VEDRTDNDKMLIVALSILVERAGGTLVIDHINEYVGRFIGLSMDINPNTEEITLTSDVDMIIGKETYGVM
jgi:hypothetical protein